jgi:hypothetical protein
MESYWINLPYACFGIEVDNGVVKRAAPIAKWSIGKNIQIVLDFYKKKGAQIVKI